MQDDPKPRFADRLKKTAAQLVDDDARDKAAGVARRGGRRVATTAKTAADAAGRSISKGAATVSLRDYRQSMEAAMAQVVEVIAAHEAEIARLRQRVEALEKGVRDSDA